MRFASLCQKDSSVITRGKFAPLAAFIIIVISLVCANMPAFASDTCNYIGRTIHIRTYSDSNYDTCVICWPFKDSIDCPSSLGCFHDTIGNTYTGQDSIYEVDDHMDTNQAFYANELETPIGPADTSFEQCLYLQIPMYFCELSSGFSLQICLNSSCHLSGMSGVSYTNIYDSTVNLTTTPSGSSPYYAMTSPNCIGIYSLPVDTTYYEKPFDSTFLGIFHDTSYYYDTSSRCYTKELIIDTSWKMHCTLEKYLTCAAINDVFNICPISDSCGGTSATVKYWTYHSGFGTDSGTNTEKVRFDGTVTRRNTGGNASQRAMGVAESAGGLNITGVAGIMTIYPNPAMNAPTITIEYAAEEDGPVQVNLYTAEGNVICAKSFNASKGDRNQFMLPVSAAYSDGMYICRISQAHSVTTKTVALLK